MYSVIYCRCRAILLQECGVACGERVRGRQYDNETVTRVGSGLLAPSWAHVMGPVDRGASRLERVCDCKSAIALRLGLPLQFQRADDHRTAGLRTGLLQCRCDAHAVQPLLEVEQSIQLREIGHRG